MSFRRPIQAGDHVLHKFLIVLVCFDAQEDTAKDHCGDEEGDKGASIWPVCAERTESAIVRLLPSRTTVFRGTQANIQNMGCPP